MKRWQIKLYWFFKPNEWSILSWEVNKAHVWLDFGFVVISAWKTVY